MVHTFFAYATTYRYDIPEIYRTTTLMEGMVNFPPASVFLRNKLFSTQVTSPTDQVALDYYNGTTRLAPFVARLKKGIAVPRERVKTSFFSPRDAIIVTPQGPVYGRDTYHPSFLRSYYHVKESAHDDINADHENSRNRNH